jgi:polyisoprenoid-binding protein YceI
MKGFYVGFIFFLVSTTSIAQKFTAEKGTISFFSDATIEDIKAENAIVGSRFNASNGELAYIIKIVDFKFPKALMREHFNEKYMETEKFPMSTFNGKVVGFKPGTAGQQKVRAVGNMTIHGVTQEVDIPGTIEFANGKVLVQSKFIVKLVDYQIKIPKLMWQNIAEEIEVTVDLTYKAL